MSATAVVTKRPQRVDIQVLRGVAVLLVVLYHWWPDLVPGGYIGVDVFFVVSGYLITDHLVRERENSGSLRWGRFWARRAQRLLPAALFVAAVTVLLITTVVPASLQPQFFREVIASVFYVQNWVLAADAVDYLAAENVASPSQHYWSLSVEEQFYLAWPLLLLVAAAVGTRWGSLRLRFTVLVSVVAGASFIASVTLVATEPGVAYFATHVRAWEFAAGALVALVGASMQHRSPLARSLLSASGFAAIAVCAWVYSADTPFPGVAAAAPVIATVAVLIATDDGAQPGVARFGKAVGLSALGNVSYAWYLWHWPIIVIARIVVGEQLGLVTAIGLGLLSLALAVVTTKYIEAPVRRIPIASRRSIVTVFALTVGAMLVVATPAALASQRAASEAAAAVEDARSDTVDRECTGGRAFVDTACDTDFDTPTAELVPAPSVAADDRTLTYTDRCVANSRSDELIVCQYGASVPTLEVLLVGDSHANHWFPAVHEIALDQSWSLTTALKAACSDTTTPSAPTEAGTSCEAWKTKLWQWAADHPPFDVVIVSHSASSDARDPRTPTIEGYWESWERYTATGAQVIVIEDTPRAFDGVVQCLEREASSASCAVPASEARAASDVMVEAARARSDLASVVETRDLLCPGAQCPVAIGGVVVFRDSHHLTGTFSATMAEPIARRLLPLIAEE